LEDKRVIQLAKSGAALLLVSLGAALAAGCWWVTATVAGSFKAVVDVVRSGLK